MPLQIEGPSNSGGVRIAQVSPDNRLMVASKSNPRGFFVSRDEKRLFNAVFTDASCAAGNYVGYILNTSPTRNLYVDLLRVWSTSTSVWLVVAATGTATGGNAVTAVNMNRGSGITPEATILADNIGGFTAGTALADTGSAAYTPVNIPFDDALILTPQTAIAVERDVAGATDRVGMTMRFFYEDIDVA